MKYVAIVANVLVVFIIGYSVGNYDPMRAAINRAVLNVVLEGSNE